MHGLGGDWDKTWRSADGDVSWPRDILPKDVHVARVLSFEYDGDVKTAWKTGQTAIAKYSKSLIAGLVDRPRPQVSSCANFVLIARSVRLTTSHASP